jgi:hypothetical protein
MLPLTVLGLFWAMLYALSGNLLVTMVRTAQRKNFVLE